ncbi:MULTISPECIES: sugar MFS transporter [unclassified Pseudoalteromonas]|uniref:sugar MFS transporter n=1 Tax=unclassified Pseudoalteromonas TaxID=194690 RepID=UPI0005AA24E3|nr:MULTISPECIES: sugar MFS transporter [unclassified Pseudoalteromonas]
MDQANAHYRGAFSLLTCLFFIWGLITTINGTLVPYFKEIFDLTFFEAGLVDWAFFISFLLMSIPSAKVIERYGYKVCLLFGIGLLFIGCLVFLLASIVVSYPLFLFALFILGIGITLLQVAANPFVSALGPNKYASSRLNLSQALNSLGKFLAPLIGAWFILDVSGFSPAEKLATIQTPYIIMASILLIALLCLKFTQLPVIAKISHQDTQTADHTLRSFYQLLIQYPHLKKGVIAIFILVGIEVSVVHYGNSYIMALRLPGYTLQSANTLVSYILIGELLGRFIGAFLLNKFPQLKSHNMLTVNALTGIALLLASIMTQGSLSLWCFILLGLCNSIMWSNIFTLSLVNIDKNTAKASSLLVTAIVGGAFIPLVVGLCADYYGIKNGFYTVIACYAYIVYFGLKGYKPVLNSEGNDAPQKLVAQ